MEHYFVVSGLVLVTMSAVLFLCSWIFTTYALAQHFPLHKIASGVLAASSIAACGVVINWFYPLSFFMIIVPAVVCALMVHAIILLFNVYLKQVEHQSLLTFPRTLVLYLNYGFFGAAAIVLLHSNSSISINYFYYTAETSIKLGICIILYFLIKTKACTVNCDAPVSAQQSQIHHNNYPDSFED